MAHNYFNTFIHNDENGQTYFKNLAHRKIFEICLTIFQHCI